MAKIALLIGVSEYEPGLEGLPAAVNDVTAMQQVLTHPEMGEFAESAVTVLPNPTRQVMEDAIYTLFANRQRDDLVLLYFSGHGVVDDGGEFYFASRFTRKEQGRLVPTTAVAAQSVRAWMEGSRSQHKVIILDSCFSGAFAKGVKAKDSGSVNPEQFLGGKGTAILTASTSTQYALTQEGFDLSVYTHYLVEGIRTGGADQDDDGRIAMEELHAYASSKVREAAPAMTPEFYPVKEGYRILLAKSPKDDPRLKYRKQVRLLAEEDEGDFSFVNRAYLEDLQRSLGLVPEDAVTIETEELNPYRQRRAKVDRYRTVFEGAIAHQYPLTDRDRLGLQRLQQLLSLRDEDVVAIEAPLLACKQFEYERQQAELQRQAEEAARLKAQADRIEQEERQQAEQQRQEEEAAQLKAQAARIEQERQQAEQQRQEEEAAQLKAQAARIEQERQQAEQQRREEEAAQLEVPALDPPPVPPTPAPNAPPPSSRSENPPRSSGSAWERPSGGSASASHRAAEPPEGRSQVLPGSARTGRVSAPITRQQFLKWAGFSGGGLAVAVASNQIFRSCQSAQPTSTSGQSAQPISVATPKVTAPGTGAAKVSGLPLWTVTFETVLVDERGQVTQRPTHQAKFVKEALGNGIELELVSLPAGSFQMGSPNTEAESTDDERPQHSVTLKSFLMGKYPVTQAQWQAVAALPKIQRDLKPDPSNFKGAKRPVEQITWDDAMEFCARLAKKTGRGYRLPSEAEWEYACRAGTTTPFYFGETITTDLANYRGTDWTLSGTTYPGNYGKGPKGKYRAETTDVDSFPPNAFGLYDMHGNVWEWCADLWHTNYQGAPTDGSAWLEGGSEKYLLRGGSWDDVPRNCRSALRYYHARDNRLYGIGFRVACSA